MHCYQLLLRIYSTMEVLWMFYSFCGKPLSAQIFWEVCVSFLGCIMHTHNNSSIANTSSFPGCSGLNLDLRDRLSVSRAIRSLKYLRKVLKQNKKTTHFWISGQNSAPVFRTAPSVWRAPCSGLDFCIGTSQPQEGHSKQLGASESAANMITI